MVLGVEIDNYISGNEVNVANIKKILDSVGVEADKAKIAIVVNNLKGKNINELIIDGQVRLGNMPAGGGGAAAVPAGPAATAAPGAAQPAAVVEKKEEKKEEPEEESDDDMGFGLFD